MKTIILSIFLLIVLIHSGNCQDISWGEPLKGLQAGVSSQSGIITIVIKNTSSQNFKICRNTNTNDLDFYHIEVRSNNKVIKEMYVGNQLQPNTQKYEFMLLPNDSYTQQVNLKDWFDKNGNTPLENGAYSITVYFEMQDCYASSSDHWNGSVRTGAVAYTVD